MKEFFSNPAVWAGAISLISLIIGVKIGWNKIMTKFVVFLRGILQDDIEHLIISEINKAAKALDEAIPDTEEKK